MLFKIGKDIEKYENSSTWQRIYNSIKIDIGSKKGTVNQYHISIDQAYHINH